MVLLGTQWSNLRSALQHLTLDPGNQGSNSKRRPTFHTHGLKCKSFITHTGNDNNSNAVKTCLQVTSWRTNGIARPEFSTQAKEMPWSSALIKLLKSPATHSYHKHLNYMVARFSFVLYHFYFCIIHCTVKYWIIFLIISFRIMFPFLLCETPALCCYPYVLLKLTKAHEEPFRFTPHDLTNWQYCIKLKDTWIDSNHNWRTKVNQAVKCGSSHRFMMKMTFQ